MTDLTKLSAGKIDALYEKRFEADRLSCHEAVNAGLGNWRYSDMRDALEGRRSDATDEQLDVMRKREATSAAFNEVVQEIKSRQAYHGSHKPIRRRY